MEIVRATFSTSEFGCDVLTAVYKYLCKPDAQPIVTVKDSTTISGSITAFNFEEDKLTMDILTDIIPKTIRLLIDSDFDFNVDTRDTKNYVVNSINVVLIREQ